MLKKKRKGGQDTAKEGRRCAGNVREAKVFEFFFVWFRINSLLYLVACEFSEG
jgi:hypothetical protein